MADRYVTIARVVKAHGRRGEVVTVPVRGLPSLIEPSMEVALVPPLLRRDRFHRVVSVQEMPEGDRVALSGLQGRNDAEEVVGTYVLVRASDLPTLEEEPQGYGALGATVVDAHAGELGEVVEVIPGVEYGTLRVSGPKGEVLIPLVDEFITGVDDVISVELPAGLIGLNGGEGEGGPSDDL